MLDKSNSFSRIRGVAWALIAVILSVAIAATTFTDLPARMGMRSSSTDDAVQSDNHSADETGSHAQDDGHSHAQDDGHAHAQDDGHAHDGEDSIELSPQARGNLGLESQVISVQTFTQYISMPGTIIDWPGRSHVAVTAPLTGVVSGIHVSRGELIRSGQALFSMRLTHQDLVKTQSDFLAALGRMDVEDREIQRLASVSQSGAVAGKTLIQRRYERDKLAAELQAERQAMLLHGLTEPQVASIEQNRELVREVTVYAPLLHPDDSLHHDSEPGHDHHDGDHQHGTTEGINHTDDSAGQEHLDDPPLPPATFPRRSELPIPEGQNRLSDASRTFNAQANGSNPWTGEIRDGGAVSQAAFAAQPIPTEHAHEHLEAEFLVTELSVIRGQSVEAGQPLGRLSDYASVLVEGHAFQTDAKALRIAANLGLPLQAVFRTAGSRPELIDGLRVSYIGNEVELDSRALPFYVPLENRIERSEQRTDGRFISWRYKPGQRLQVRVPLRQFDDVFVVPIDAVAEEGAERYAFVDHGDHLDRHPVRVVARDAIWVAIANDGSIRSGQNIAISGAHQLQMAMKKAAGGPIDPHHGHSH